MTELRIIATKPFSEHRHLPRGLRQSLSIFQQPHYLANLVQCFLGILGDRTGQTLVIGGDGQMMTKELLQIVLKIAAASGLSRIIIGSQGVLSPSILSYLIGHYQAIGGILLSSRQLENEREIQLDYYEKNGRIASSHILEALQERSQIIQNYQLLDIPDLNFNRAMVISLENLTLEVINSAAIYSKLLASLFDLDAIQDYLLPQNYPIAVKCFDPVNYAYGQLLLEKNLGLPIGTVSFETFPPLLDTLEARINLPRGNHPPSLTAVLTQHRYGIFGKERGVTASDSLAILVAHTALIPAYRGQEITVARSPFASVAVDHVCARLAFPCYESSDQWEFLSESLESSGITLAGNERGELGANFSRERDGLWALLFWLNILALRQQSVETILQSHWLKYGRNYHLCQTYRDIDLEILYPFWESLQNQGFREQANGHHEIVYSYPLKYYDQRQFQTIEQGGYCLGLTDGSRIIFKFEQGLNSQNTGNLQIYLESYEPNALAQSLTPRSALAPLLAWIESLSWVQNLNKALLNTAPIRKTR